MCLRLDFWRCFLFPVFVLFGREFSMYAVMSVLGLLCGGVLFCQRIRKKTQDDTEAILFLLVLSVGILIGGHALYGLTNLEKMPRLFECASFSGFISVLNAIFGGMIFYGGLIGAYLFGILYAKIKKLDLVLYMDSAALFAPIFHGFARVGCFFGGCCYGIESHFGFAASGNTITSIGDVSRFPVQLLEATCNFLIALVICFLLKSERCKGRVFYVYLALYAFIRFFDEFLRGDEIRGFIFGLSTSQFISIFVEIFALVMLCTLSIQERRRRI